MVFVKISLLSIYMGVASQLTGFNMQLTIDQRATQLLNMPYFSSKDKGKNNNAHVCILKNARDSEAAVGQSAAR